MVDYFGKQIEVGDLIVYPGRRGANLWMNHGTVVAIEPDYKVSSYKKGRITVAYLSDELSNIFSPKNGRTAKITCLDRVVVTEKGRLVSTEAK